jgi:hypothetical protein
MIAAAPLEDAFRDAFRHHPAGVAVIADPGDGPAALTARSLISVSADPPTVAFSLSAPSTRAAAIGHERAIAGATRVVAERLEGEVPPGGATSESLSIVYLNRCWRGLRPVMDGAA